MVSSTCIFYLVPASRMSHVACGEIISDHFGWMEEGEFEVSAFQLSCLKLKRGQTFPAFLKKELAFF